MNESFDDRMKRFALKKETRERSKRKREEPDIDPDHPIFLDYNKPQARISQEQMRNMSTSNEQLKGHDDELDDDPVDAKGQYTYV